jgi:hypothetical protein
MSLDTINEHEASTAIMSIMNASIDDEYALTTSPQGASLANNFLTSTPIHNGMSTAMNGGGWKEREMHYKQQLAQAEAHISQLKQENVRREKVST